MMRHKTSKLSWKSARAWLLICGFLLAPPTFAQQQLESDYRLTGKEVTKVFEPIRLVLQESSAVVLDGWKSVGYGVVVSSDGQILVKASEISDLEKLSIRVGAKSYKEVKVAAVNPEWDVALIKIEAEGLVPVTWADGEVVHGMWVVSNGSTSRQRRRVRVGIISANTREIAGAVPVVLGLVLQKSEAEDHDIVVEAVAEKSGAERAGIKEGDLIKAAEGVDLKDREQLLAMLKTKSAGDELALTVERDGEKMEFSVELAARSDVFAERKTRNDAMSGRTSGRRSSFKRVLQHDIGLSERSVGGPLLDLEGHCVGMNIARFSRAESFAIPAAELKEILGELLQDVEE